MRTTTEICPELRRGPVSRWLTALAGVALASVALTHSGSAQGQPTSEGETASPAVAATGPSADAAPPPLLTAGRYAATAGDRFFELTLEADGRAVFGGAPYRWSMSDGVLTLQAPGGRALSLTATTRGGQPTLLGDTLGALTLRRLPPLPDDGGAPGAVTTGTEGFARPLAWRGAWIHRADRGEVALRLTGDGRYTQTRYVLGQPPRETTGRWTADLDALILHPTGGRPIRYAARRSGPDLELWGGDLPRRVRFEPDTPR